MMVTPWITAEAGNYKLVIPFSIRDELVDLYRKGIEGLSWRKVFHLYKVRLCFLIHLGSWSKYSCKTETYACYLDFLGSLTRSHTK